MISALLRGVVGAAHRGAGFPEGADEHHAVGDDAADAQRAEHLHQVLDVLIFIVLDGERLERRRLRHQPEAHLGDDAIVGLGKDTIQVWAIAPLEYLPDVGVGDATHGGAQHLAVGQDHFHAAGEHKVLGIRSIADAAIQGVADRTDDG